MHQNKPPRSTIATLSLFAVSMMTASVLGNENWPAWRGPLANGIAPTAKPPLTWSETSNVKWKVKIPGKGSATPIIWENRVFVATAFPASGAAAGPLAGGNSSGQNTPPPGEPYRFVIQCLDRQTGKLLWEQVAREEAPHEGHHPDGTYASCSPFTDGQRVYAFFGSHGLYCYDMDGKLQWSQDLGDMKIRLGFGEGSSPVLHGDAIIVNWDHEGGSFITSLNKNTGETIWKTPRDEMTSWSTPFIVEHAGQKQIVTAATGKIRTYDFSTGKLLWECKGLTRNAIPTPVAGNSIVYCTSGYSGNAVLAIRLGGSGDLTDTNSIVWKHNRNTPYVPSPLLVNDRLYLFAGNNAVLSSFDAATGKLLIDAKRIDAMEGVYASPVNADGRIYMVGRNGTTVVIKQSDSLEILATNKLDDRIDASPAAVGGELFLRGKEYLYCIAEK